MSSTEFLYLHPCVKLQEEAVWSFHRRVWHCFHPFPTVVPNSTKVADEEKKFRDCADLYQAGVHKNGVYTIQINPQETKKVQSRNVSRPAVHSNAKTSRFQHFCSALLAADPTCSCCERLASEGADECEWRLRAAAGGLILTAKNTAWQLLCLREFSEGGAAWGVRH